MIKCFKDRETEKVFHREYSRKFPPELHKRAHKKLKWVHRAKSINELYALPGNHLKQLKGTRKSQYSIRINDQWRICFYWNENNAYDVEITDYH